MRFEFAFAPIDPPSDNITPPAVTFVPPNRFELTLCKTEYGLTCHLLQSGAKPKK
jgi:hypothetical protein